MQCHIQILLTDGKGILFVLPISFHAGVFKKVDMKHFNRWRNSY